MAAEKTEQAQNRTALPDSKTLEEAGELPILSEDGNEILFKTLYTGEPRSLIVFIRHFFCGQCEDYVRALTADLSPSMLSSMSPPVKLTIIGCGEPAAAVGYKERTGTQFPIYCDPKRSIYIKLGMTRSLELGNKQPEYIRSGLVMQSLKSAFIMLRGGSTIFKGGDYSQNGGEWVFENGNLVWCRRMLNTRDHTEIKELKEVLSAKE